MKSRKGEELVGEGLGIVLAIIGLVILGALGYGLYNLFVNQDMKNAKEFIESLSSKAEALEDGEGNTFALPGITGWVLVGWNKGSTDKPEKCFDQNCLCLCNGAGDAITCQKNGYCRNVDRSVSVSSIGEADFIGDDASTFGKFSAQCVFLEDDVLIAISVKKEKDSLKITRDYGSIKSGDAYDSISVGLASCKFVPSSTNRLPF